MKRRRKNNRKFGCLFILILIVLIITFTVSKCSKEKTVPPETTSNYNSSRVNTMREEFAEKHSLQTNAWPDNLIELLEKNPETKDFVLNYPLKKDEKFEIDLSEYENSKKVPLFMQWDERWGYSKYAGDLMGLTGCGPTCLSMVSIYLLNDDKYTPKYVAEFSERNGYSVSGNGSSWSLISDGGKELGLDVIEIPLDENRIIRNLEVGNPIICIMGPGDFTTTGHFIVMTEYVDGKIKVNDPNSKTRSEKLWNLSDIKHQIRNLWVCRV
ncbi:MAG: C39 family peptidase [Clostridia bacterium]|nr:C39 family peptidase [Clostridia bacterium]